LAWIPGFSSIETTSTFSGYQRAARRPRPSAPRTLAARSPSLPDEHARHTHVAGLPNSIVASGRAAIGKTALGQVRVEGRISLMRNLAAVFLY
jgi:hypothetical protein